MQNNYSTFSTTMLTLCLAFALCLATLSCSKKDKDISGGERPPPVIKGQDPVESEFVTVSGAITKVPR